MLRTDECEQVFLWYFFVLIAIRRRCFVFCRVDCNPQTVLCGTVIFQLVLCFSMLLTSWCGRHAWHSLNGGVHVDRPVDPACKTCRVDFKLALVMSTHGEASETSAGLGPLSDSQLFRGTGFRGYAQNIPSKFCQLLGTTSSWGQPISTDRC
jgi:hypothetical protein